MNSGSASQKDLPLPALKTTGAGSVLYDSQIEILTDDALIESCGVRLAFSYRKGGLSKGEYEGLNLASHCGDDVECVRKNREILLDALKFNAADSLINPTQIHSDNIAIFTGEDSLDHLQGAVDLLETQGVELFTEPVTSPELQCDAVVCDLTNVPVMLCFADCVPVIVVAPNGTFCVIHSGWKGTLASISEKAVNALSVASGYKSSSMNAYIGPHIGPCCYEVSEEMLDSFVAEFGEGCDAFGNRLNLSYAINASLSAAGIDQDRIISSEICTSCNCDKFYSYRASGGVTGRFAAICCKID